MNGVEFSDSGLLADLHHHNVINSLLIMAVCHSVEVYQQSDNYHYVATSPDELALLNFAKMLGFRYLGKDHNNLVKI